MKKKAIAHNLFGSFSNFAFVLLTGIVLLPYYLKFISTSDYGIWLGGISFLSLASVLEANISLILTQQLGEKWVNKNINEFSKYYFAAIGFGVIVFVAIFLVTFLIKDSLTQWVSPGGQHNSTFSNSFLIYSISLGLSILVGFISTIAQVFLKTLLPPFFNIASAIIGITYTILAVPTQGVMAIAAGALLKNISYLFFISFYAILLLKRNKIPFLFEINHLYMLVQSIGLPFISKVAITIAVNIQNFVIAATISSSSTTIFDITRKVPSIIQMAVNMVAVSTFTSFSLFYSERKDNQSHPYTKYYFSFIRIVLLISLFFVFLLGQDFIKIWVGLDKFGGNMLLALLCITILLDQLRGTLSQQYYAIGNFNFTSITDSIFALSFILFAAILIPFMKLYGIVIAGILANISYFIFCRIMEKKKATDMIQNIINPQLFIEFVGIVILAIISKYFYELYRGNIIIDLVIVLLSIAILTVFTIIRQREIINFFIHKILNFKKK